MPELPAADLGEVVHSGVLKQGGYDKPVTHEDEPVQGCRVGHLRQVVTRVEADCRQRKNSCDTCNVQCKRLELVCLVLWFVRR